MNIPPYFTYITTLSCFNSDKAVLLKSANHILDDLIDKTEIRFCFEDDEEEEIKFFVPSNKIAPEESENIKSDMITTTLDNLKEAMDEEDEEELFVFIEEEEETDSAQDIIVNDVPLVEDDSKTINWIDAAAINHISEEMKSDRSNEGEKNYRLSSYIKRLNPNKPIINIPNYSIFDDLTKTSPHFQDVANYYKGSFILNHFKVKNNEDYSAPLPLLLLGDPGIGKTFFAKELAKVLHTSSYMVDANSITASWVLTGSSGQWRSAEAGIIFQQMLDSPTISPIIIFDEIDKLSNGKNYDPFSTFHQILEPENSKALKDEYLGCDFDASHIIYILTANDASCVPESLLSRMKVIHINKPDIKTTHIIAQNIYSSIIGNSGLFKPKLNKLQLSQLEKLTPREIKQLINNCVFNALSQVDMSKVDKVKKNQTLLIKNEKSEKSFGFVK